MANVVTVLGAGNVVMALFSGGSFSNRPQNMADGITGGVLAGSLLPPVDVTAAAPVPQPGPKGTMIDTISGAAVAEPAGFGAVVMATLGAATLFGNGGANQSILSSIGALTYVPTGGSGTLVAGGARNTVLLPASGSGAFQINLDAGLGANTVIGGSGPLTLTDADRDFVALGSGDATVYATTGDTIIGGSGALALGANALLGANLIVLGSGDAAIGGGSYYAANTIIGGSGNLVYTDG